MANVTFTGTSSQTFTCTKNDGVSIVSEGLTGTVNIVYVFDDGAEENLKDLGTVIAYTADFSDVLNLRIGSKFRFEQTGGTPATTNINVDGF
jgi:hypothetical protein